MTDNFLTSMTYLEHFLIENFCLLWYCLETTVHSAGIQGTTQCKQIRKIQVYLQEITAKDSIIYSTVPEKNYAERMRQKYWVCVNKDVF